MKISLSAVLTILTKILPDEIISLTATKDADGFIIGCDTSNNYGYIIYNKKTQEIESGSNCWIEAIDKAIGSGEDEKWQEVLDRIDNDWSEEAYEKEKL